LIAVVVVVIIEGRYIGSCGSLIDANQDGSSDTPTVLAFPTF